MTDDRPHNGEIGIGEIAHARAFSPKVLDEMHAQ